MMFGKSAGKSTGAMLTLLWLLAGCSTQQTPAPVGCAETDRAVTSSAECLQDDAACYQLDAGGWCTGPRAATCPDDAQALPADALCPQMSKCFQVSESLRCVAPAHQN